jgi:hypothetical protein
MKELVAYQRRTLVDYATHVRQLPPLERESISY